MLDNNDNTIKLYVILPDDNKIYIDIIFNGQAPAYFSNDMVMLYNIQLPAYYKTEEKCWSILDDYKFAFPLLGLPLSEANWGTLFSTSHIFNTLSYYIKRTASVYRSTWENCLKTLVADLSYSLFQLVFAVKTRRDIWNAVNTYDIHYNRSPSVNVLHKSIKFSNYYKIEEIVQCIQEQLNKAMTYNSK